MSLGNVLIKPAAGLFAAEFPRVKRFCTLSSMPGFRDWLRRATIATENTEALPATLRKRLDNVRHTIGPLLNKGVGELRAAERARAKCADDLERLCAAYLLGTGEDAGTTRDRWRAFM